MAVQSNTRGDIELELQKIWQALLPQVTVCAETNFFEHGDSLAAFSMISTCEFYFNLELDLADLLEGPCLHEFASRLRTAVGHN